MKNGYTDITILLDKSGSMASITKDTIGGFNTFIEEQKKTIGTLKVTLIQFDNLYEENYTALDINHVKPLDTDTYKPRGSTALVDALGRIIDETGRRFSNMPEYKHPEKIVILVITDGQENASKIYGKTSVKDKIEHQQNVYKWAFVFMGADQNSFLSAKEYNISGLNSVDWIKNAIGIDKVWKDISCSTSTYRNSATADNLNYMGK